MESGAPSQALVCSDLVCDTLARPILIDAHQAREQAAQSKVWAIPLLVQCQAKAAELAQPLVESRRELAEPSRTSQEALEMV